MRRIRFFPAAVIPAIIVATLALAGCSANPTSTNESGGVVSSDGAPSGLRDGGSGELAPAESKADSDRQVITTGYVTITVDKPVDASAEAVRIVEQSGGRVDGRAETAPVNGNDGSATLTLRIPADTLTATLGKLRNLGAVQEVSLTSSDVTLETQDLDARITALTASVDRLLQLLATATDTENLITLETAISDRQAQLESLESQRRYYADQVSLSTLTLNLVSNFTAPIAEPDNFLDGIVAGWNSFVGFFAGALVVVGVLLPWVVFLGIIALVVVMIVKRRSRKSPARTAVQLADTPAGD
jgi:hypothetical protein